MKPSERENNIYKKGRECQISKEEMILFEFLEKFVATKSRILDIGCGSGEITSKVKEKGYSTTGLDFSSVAIERAKRGGLDCQVADLDTGIPFDNDTFDAVWAGDVIEHLFDPIFVLKEVSRVLVPGGAFLCTIPYDLHLVTRLRILFGHSYQEGVYKKFGQYKHHTFFSIPLMKYMLNESFLQIQDIKFVIKLPKIRKEFICHNHALSFFAKIMVIRATSTKS